MPTFDDQQRPAAVKGLLLLLIAACAGCTTVDSRRQQLVLAHVRAIEQRQTAEGYWPTLHTTTHLFRDAQVEVNTFTPAFVADLLAPVASQACLEENVARARRFLARQIEDDGLVRYHGRPDSPYLPQFGSVITPDADDT